MTYDRAALDDLQNALRRAGVDHPALEARWIREEYPTLGAHDAYQIVTRREAGEPLSRIFGWREFYGRRFDLSPATLDPRPETEGIIDCVLAHARKQDVQTIIDLGTGSGCLAVTLAREISGARVTATDCNPEALATAAANAQRHGVAIDCIQSDWWECVRGSFDVVVANPPYIPQADLVTLDVSVRAHDPWIALDGGADGLAAYRRLFTGLRDHLNEGGVAFFEIGYDQGESVPELARSLGLCVRAVHRDGAGHPRIVDIAANGTVVQECG